MKKRTKKMTLTEQEISNRNKFKKMRIGTVFEFEDGSLGLRVGHGCALLLNRPWLQPSNFYLAQPIKKVVGHIREITFVDNEDGKLCWAWQNK